MTRVPIPQPYRLRPIADADRTDLSRFYASLSAESRLRRFHGTAPTIPETTAAFFCGPDHEHREGIVAEATDTAGGVTIIGHVCIEPITAEMAEMAIAVADAWQRHGVGQAMLARAIAWAQAHGVTRLSASVRCDNAGIFALLRSTGYPMSYGGSIDGAIDVTLDLRHPLALAA